jgi:hypothetical protein
MCLGAGESDGLVDKEFGATARHEDAGFDGNPQATEFGPSEDLFQRQAGDAAFHHGL